MIAGESGRPSRCQSSGFKLRSCLVLPVPVPVPSLLPPSLCPSAGSPPITTKPRDIDKPHRFCFQFNAVEFVVQNCGPGQPNSRFELFRFRAIPGGALPPVESDCVEACQARSLHYQTTRRVSDQQPAQPARLADGQTDIQPGRASSPVSCAPVFRTWPASLALAPAHTHTTPNKPRYMHSFLLLQYQACCRRSSGAAPNFTPATDPFLPVSHMPQLLRFVRPSAQQTDDETSPHWHRTVDCSGAPSEASGAAE